MIPITEGGTWLGIDSKGRLAILTNVYTGKTIKSEGRGFIVIDYLNGENSAMEFVAELSEKSGMYSPFNLCIFEPQDNHGYEPLYFKNTFKNESSGIDIQGEGPKVLQLGVAGFGNHPFSEPYRKTIFGINEFKTMLQKNMDLKRLEDDAVNLLSNTQKMYPDVQMQKQSGIYGKVRDTNGSQCTSESLQSDTQSIKQNDDEDNLVMQKEKLLSSIFVDIGEKYGTRMQTIVFIDYEHNVHFVERTRISQTIPFKWDVKTYDFTF